MKRDRKRPSEQEARLAEAEAALATVQDIDALLLIRGRAALSLDGHQRLLERFTQLVGRPAAVYLIGLGAVVWMAWNTLAPKLGWIARAYDPPPFTGLELVLSISALLVSTAILTTQNRQNRFAEERSHLDLQVNLLAERKIAKLIALVEELRADMPNVRNRVDKVANAMKAPVDPHAVLDALSRAEDQPPAKAEPDS